MEAHSPAESQEARKRLRGLQPAPAGAAATLGFGRPLGLGHVRFFYLATRGYAAMGPKGRACILLAVSAAAAGTWAQPRAPLFGQSNTAGAPAAAGPGPREPADAAWRSGGLAGHTTRHDEVLSDAASADDNAVVMRARAFLGRHYVRGASGPSTFDCSGLVVHVLSSFGWRGPRTVVDLIQIGHAIDFDDIQPGDLLFFSHRPNSDSAHHVGIATKPYHMLHASSGRKRVVEDRLGPYYRRRFVAARRLSLPSNF